MFLRQSLATPCLYVLESVSGSRLVGVGDREILDFCAASLDAISVGGRAPHRPDRCPWYGHALGRGHRPIAANAVAEWIIYACQERGLSFNVGGSNILTLCQLLTIAESDFDQAFTVFDTTVAEVAAQI